MDVRAQGVWGIALVLVAGLAAVDLLVVYDLGLVPGVVLPVGAAGAVVVWRAPIVGVCAGVLTVPLEAYGLSLGGFAGLSVPELCFIGTAAVGAAHLTLERSWRPLDRPHAAFAGLLLVVALGYVVADDPGTLTKIFLAWSAFLLVSMLVARAPRQDLERVLLSLGVSSGIVGLIAILNAGDQSLASGGAIVAGRAQGTFDQPNLLGFFLALTIPVAILMASRGSLTQRVTMLAAAGAGGAGLMLTLSRTSIVGTFFALLILLLWPPFRHLAAVGLAALAIFALFNAGALSKSGQVQRVGERLGTLTSQGISGDAGRKQLYTQTPAIILDHPLLGVGEGNFSIAAADAEILDPDGLPFDHAHDIPLTVAAETGLTGLAALVVFVVFLFGTARRALRRASAVWPLALASTAALSATIVTGLGDYPPRSNVIMATIMVHVGVLVACARLAPPPARPDSRAATPLPP